MHIEPERWSKCRAAKFSFLSLFLQFPICSAALSAACNISDKHEKVLYFSLLMFMLRPNAMYLATERAYVQ